MLRKALMMTAALGVAFYQPAQAAEEVNLYSARKEALIKPLLDRFTEQTGVKVNLVTGKADALLKRLQSEGKNTPADIFLTVDAGRLHRAQQAGLFQPTVSKTLEDTIPSQYRDRNGEWYGLSLRARTIFYVKDRVNPSEITSYEDLADPRWKGRICIRSSGNIYNQSLVASMIEANGEAATEAWAKGLVTNMARKPKGGDRDQVKAAVAGVCDITVVNTYYMGKMLHAKKDKERKAGEMMSVLWPNQDGRGVHVNVSGAGILKNAKNKANATRLLEFLSSEESQKWYAEVNYEYPVRAGVELSETLQNWGPPKMDTLNLNKLGENNAAAVRLMDRAGWR